MHGFGDYCERSAYIFKTKAACGYDCVAFDQRGYGNSEGERGFYENPDQIYGDIWAFIFILLKYSRSTSRKLHYSYLEDLLVD